MWIFISLSFQKIYYTLVYYIAKIGIGKINKLPLYYLNVKLKLSSTCGENVGKSSKGNFLFLLRGLSFMEIWIEYCAVPAIDLVPRACEVKVKWKKVKIIFWSLNLFIFGYVKGGVLGNNNIGIKKCTTNFLWVFNFGQVGGRQINFPNHDATMIFSKMVSKVIFGKILKEISL